MRKIINGRACTFILMVILLCFIYPADAQEPGTVTVIKDPAIDLLIARRIELEREAAGTPRITVEGYRVQIFSGTDREQTYKEQSKFKALYPSINTYISYTQPNYKVRVGDFRTRMEAEKFMNQVRKTYPTLFIFQERINLSR
jgi:hypothetical protein